MSSATGKVITTALPILDGGYPHLIGKFFSAIYFGPALMFVICEYQFPILSRKVLHASFEALVSQIDLFRRVGGGGF